MDSTTGWIVAAGCCWTNIFMYSILRSAAIVYVAILGSLQGTRAEASWPINVMAVLSCVAGPAVGWLGTRIPFWKLTVSACLVGSLSVAACFFANGIWFLVVFLGVLHGISMAFTVLCSAVIRTHFTRYRTLACGISYAGLTISGLIFPPLLQFLLDKYGPEGMFLMTGALMLNATAGALLQRLPPETGTKPGCVLDEDRNHEPPVDKLPSDKSGLREYDIEDADSGLSLEDECILTQEDLLRESEPTWMSRGRLDNQLVPLSDPRTTEGEGCSKETEPRSREYVIDNSHPEVPSHIVRSFSHQSKFVLSAYLRLPKFYIISLAGAVIIFNMNTYSTIVVDFATDRKVSQWDAISLLMIFAVADLTSRLGSGWITDKGLMSRSSTLAANLALWALSFCLMPFCHSFYLHAIQAVVVGWCTGATLILVPVLLMEIVDSVEFSECLGVSCLITGYFRDNLGDYQGLFILMGVAAGLSAFSCLFLRGNPEKRPLL